MQRWQRPYSVDDGMTMAALYLTIAGLASTVAVVDLLMGGALRFVYVGFWLATALLIRPLRVGLYVGDRGVQVRRYWSTVTVAWDDIAAVDAVRAGGWITGAIYIMYITTRSGSTILTPLRRGSPGLWRPALRASQRGGLHFRTVPVSQFDAVLRLLRMRLIT
jgi:hypothetical protein